MTITTSPAFRRESAAFASKTQLDREIACLYALEQLREDPPAVERLSVIRCRALCGGCPLDVSPCLLTHCLENLGFELFEVGRYARITACHSVDVDLGEALATHVSLDSEAACGLACSSRVSSAATIRWRVCL